MLGIKCSKRGQGTEVGIEGLLLGENGQRWPLGVRIRQNETRGGGVVRSMHRGERVTERSR